VFRKILEINKGCFSNGMNRQLFVKHRQYIFCKVGTQASKDSVALLQQSALHSVTSRSALLC
jgi:hypothetical protein